MSRAVALFTRAWIEIRRIALAWSIVKVALFTRAWIEIIHYNHNQKNADVALFTRAWIEMLYDTLRLCAVLSPSLRGRGLKCSIV